jgi:hypothetical protein
VQCCAKGLIGRAECRDANSECSRRIIQSKEFPLFDRIFRRYQVAGSLLIVSSAEMTQDRSELLDARGSLWQLFGESDESEEMIVPQGDAASKLGVACCF